MFDLNFQPSRSIIFDELLQPCPTSDCQFMTRGLEFEIFGDAASTIRSEPLKLVQLTWRLLKDKMHAFFLQQSPRILDFNMRIITDTRKRKGLNDLEVYEVSRVMFFPVCCTTISSYLLCFPLPPGKTTTFLELALPSVPHVPRALNWSFAGELRHRCRYYLWKSRAGAEQRFLRV